jgi:hypothetical protein
VVAQKKANQVAKKSIKDIGNAVQVLAQRHGSQQSFTDFVAARVNSELGIDT